jgi:porin
MSAASPFRIVMALACFVLSVRAQAQDEPVTTEKRSEDGITAAIDIRDNQFLDSPYEKRKARRTAWMQALGLDVVFTYDALAMGVVGDDSDWGASSGDATLNLRWQIRPETKKWPLSLNIRMRQRHAYSDLAPSELRRETGTLWGHVDGFTDADFQIPEIYIEHRFFERRLTLRYGQMTIDDLLDGHQLRSAKRSFMNQAVASSPGVGFPGSDTGFIARWQSRDGWDLTLGLTNVDSTNLSESTSWQLLGGALFQGLQLGYTFEGWKGRETRAQVLAWKSDAMEKIDLPHGSGLSFTVEQDFSARTRSFFRYALADGQAAVTSHFASAGIARDFGHSDRLGLALGAGKSSRNSDVWQGVIELFYRRKIGKHLLITPDIQLVGGDGMGGSSNWYLIGGLRTGFTF